MTKRVVTGEWNKQLRTHCWMQFQMMQQQRSEWQCSPGEWKVLWESHICWVVQCRTWSLQTPTSLQLHWGMEWSLWWSWVCTQWSWKQDWGQSLWQLLSVWFALSMVVPLFSWMPLHPSHYPLLPFYWPSPNHNAINVIFTFSHPFRWMVIWCIWGKLIEKIVVQFV